MSVQIDHPAVVQLQQPYQMMPNDHSMAYTQYDDTNTNIHYQHNNTDTYEDEVSEFTDAQEMPQSSEYNEAAAEENYSEVQSEMGDHEGNFSEISDGEAHNDSYKHERQLSQEQLQYSNSTPSSPAEEIIRPIDPMAHVDFAGELEKIRGRLAVLSNDSQSDMESEIILLKELEKSTEMLVISRKLISEKQRQFILIHINDSRRPCKYLLMDPHRPSLQTELLQLINDNKVVQSQWCVDMEAYHQEYVVAAAAAAAEAAAKANAEQRVTLESEIKILRDQVTNLRRQLEAVTSRRKQMLADAEEQQRIMRRNCEHP
ncbi:hypothetical protein BGZ76_005776 [Entomortierella beljakovae]|nr:hypothetical protein BGZ76_005776 [Entomortierella beljakovae]